MWLLIDDKRDLGCDVIARTPVAGKMLLALGGWECLCIDHDLGAEESGYDIIKWGLQNGFIPKWVQIVSSNPVGRENIKNILIDHLYTTSGGINFECSV